MLEKAGYDGPRHFDAHAYRTENEDGVWDFALGCMRTYNIFKEKARRFDADPEVQQLFKEINDEGSPYAALLSKGYSAETVRQLQEATFDPDALGRQGYSYEKLDQMSIEHIMGVR